MHEQGLGPERLDLWRFSIGVPWSNALYLSIFELTLFHL